MVESEEDPDPSEPRSESAAAAPDWDAEDSNQYGTRRGRTRERAERARQERKQEAKQQRARFRLRHAAYRWIAAVVISFILAATIVLLQHNRVSTERQTLRQEIAVLREELVRLRNSRPTVTLPPTPQQLDPIIQLQQIKLLLESSEGKPPSTMEAAKKTALGLLDWLLAQGKIAASDAQTLKQKILEAGVASASHAIDKIVDKLVDMIPGGGKGNDAGSTPAWADSRFNVQFYCGVPPPAPRAQCPKPPTPCEKKDKTNTATQDRCTK